MNALRNVTKLKFRPWSPYGRGKKQYRATNIQHNLFPLQWTQIKGSRQPWRRSSLSVFFFDQGGWSSRPEICNSNNKYKRCILIPLRGYIPDSQSTDKKKKISLFYLTLRRAELGKAGQQVTQRYGLLKKKKSSNTADFPMSYTLLITCSLNPCR